MLTVQAIGMVLTAILFGIVGFYLTLIAKFYRQKFFKGPPYRYLQLALAVLIAGLLLKAGVFAFLPHYVASAFIIAGGLGFTALCYALYRTMMSVD